MPSESRDYVVIYFGQDGDPASVEQMSAQELRKRLNEKYYGERVKFADEGPSRVETEYFSGLIIVRGRIVTPKPVQVTTEYDL